MFDIYPVLCRAGKMNNYSYILVDKDNNLTLVIDPSETAPIVKKLEELGRKPDFILNTHHHFDHTDSNIPLKEKYGCKIIGNEHDKSRIPAFDMGVEAGKGYELSPSSLRETKIIHLRHCEESRRVDVAIQLKQKNDNAEPHHPELVSKSPIKGSPASFFTVLDASAHTQGHVLYYFPAEKALFTGDTLFNLSIGGLFEGTPEQMFIALAKIKSLPEDTYFYAGHEYTAYGANQAFEACGGNQDIQNYLQKAQNNLRQNKTAGPFTLKEEVACNPYLRAQTIEEFKYLF